MSKGEFRRVIDLNKEYMREKSIRVVPYFNGESLIHPDIFEMLDYVQQQRLLLADLNTNLGMAIDIERLMSYPFEKIVVNIGGITKDVHERVMRRTRFEEVIGNLSRMFEINKDLVWVKMNPTKHNVSEIPRLKDFVRTLGGDPRHAYVSRTGFILPSVASEEESDEFFDDVVSADLRPYLRFTYDLTKPGKGIRAKARYCNWLSDCITFNGNFTVCCHDQLNKIRVANAFETPLKEIHASGAYRTALRTAIRRGYPMCKECN